MKWSSSNSLLHASISTKLSLPSVFSWKSTFSVFLHVLYHLYIIYISFIFDSLDVLFTSFTTSGVYSLRCFIDPLSPPSILHQLPPSFFSSPVVHFVSFFLFFSLRSLSLSFLSCFCAVADIYNHSDLLSFFLTPKVSLPLISSFPPLLFSSFVFHLESFVFLLSCSAPSRSRGLLRWWTKAVCCRWSSTLSFSPRWVSWGCVQTLRGPRVFTSACKKEAVIVFVAEPASRRSALDWIRGWCCCLITRSEAQQCWYWLKLLIYLYLYFFISTWGNTEFLETHRRKLKSHWRLSSTLQWALSF